MALEREGFVFIPLPQATQVALFKNFKWNLIASYYWEFQYSDFIFFLLC